MESQYIFRGRVLPYILVAPQLAITLVFFVWPASQALYQSLLIEDAFGLSTEFVWLENFTALFQNDDYLNSFRVTITFSAGTTMLSIGSSLLLAVCADRVIRGASGYKMMLLLPYAIAPVVAGILWWFLFNPNIGILAYFLSRMDYEWNHYVNGTHALWLVTMAAAWKHVSYNFVFFLAGLQSIPRSLIEAAAIDGAGPFRRFWRITFPLLGPTTFFLLVMNVVYAFFDTFGIIHATTSGGPARSTEILVYKVYKDGFVGFDLGSSAAQSVILMAFVIVLTIFQFRFIERRVFY